MTTTVNQKVANPYFTDSSSTFATDITVNGLTVGRGDGNVATNTAFGFDALGSPYASASNVNNVGIGYNSLNIIGAGVNTFTNRVGGSGYEDGDGNTTFTQTTYLTYLRGTPLISGGQFPYVDIRVTSGVVTSIAFNNNQINNRGYGFTDTTTVMTAVIGDYGSGFEIKVGTLLYSNNNVAIGYNTGLAVTENAISIGNNAKAASNTVELGNNSIVQTNLYGNLNNYGGDVSFSGSSYGNIILGDSMLAGYVTIGSLYGTGNINIGTSVSTQTVNIATGNTTAGDFKYVNIGTGIGSLAETVIQIGSTSGTSTTKINGTTIQQTYLVVNLPTGTVGARSFVTNHRSATANPVFNETVSSTGTFGPFTVPVFHNGSVWKVG